MPHDAADNTADWISAHEAYELVYERNRDPDAALTISKHAHAGLVRARAHLFVRKLAAARGVPEELRQEGAELPAEFWWADGEAGLEQDWEAGEFTTWIDSKFKWRAFGVKFDRSGIEAMLVPPVPQTEFSRIASESAHRKERSRPIAKSRKLTHNHPYVAAKTVFELMNLPETERSRLTGPSVGRTMRDHYEQNAERWPHVDNLDEYGESVLRALKEYWQPQAG